MPLLLLLIFVLWTEINTEGTCDAADSTEIKRLSENGFQEYFQ